MELHQQWPRELLNHYWRLESDLQKLITSYVIQHAQEDEDRLISFINGIIALTEIEGEVFSNSEFLFLNMLSDHHFEIVYLFHESFLCVA